MLKQLDQKKMKATIDRLSEMIEMQYLRRLEVKVKLMRGDKCEEATDYWSHNELMMFKEKKEVKISQRSKEIYQAEDDVVVKMTLKNVK